MDCPLRSGTDLAERYVAGTASEEEQSAFETHFFACAACFAHVQLLQDVRDGLPAPSGTHTSHAGGHPARGLGWRVGPLVGLAAAAALVVGLAYLISGDPGAPPAQARITPAPAPAGPPAPGPEPLVAPSPAPGPPPITPAPAPAPASRTAVLQQLALMVPPRYVPLTVRGGEASAGSFDAAMAHYVAGRHGEAARALDALAAARPTDADIAFFLGISELASGRTAAAREALTRAVSLGAQPYADEAHFYLGKAALRAGDLAAARAELILAIEHDAGPEGEAARIVAALARLPR